MTNGELFLEFLSVKGLKEKGLLNNPVYVSRAKHEFDRITRKGYTGYFLSVWEYTNWAKQNGIFVGPGRGSVGGSLISYLLDITTVDPIEHNLLFARFISEIRRDAPDIDLDFQDDRRKEVFKHLAETYGESKTSFIMTYSRFHAKGVLRDLGRIFSIPIPEIEKICSLVLERSGGDARCVSGDSNVYSDNKIKKIKEIKKNDVVLAIDLKSKKIKETKVLNFFNNGVQDIFEVQLESGKKIMCTENHKFLTKSGWKRLKDIKEKDYIGVIDI